MNLRPAALLAALLCAVALLSAAAPAGAVIVGIGDQKPEMFTDPLFHRLGVQDVRVVVPWDVMSNKRSRAQLDTWMAGSELAGTQPLLSFGASLTHRRRLPSTRQLQVAFRLLRERYPAATTWATWNEANHCSQPVCHKPEVVARFYDMLRRTCPSCTIVAAEVLDQPNMTSWVKSFQRHATHAPRLWGLHNYLDANRMRTKGTKALLRVTKGRIWFTETGGIVARNNKSSVKGFPETPSHAAQATRWLFDRLVPLSKRITRVYLYHWNAGPPGSSWDSALLTPAGRPRPAMAIVEKELRAQALRRGR